MIKLNEFNIDKVIDSVSRNDLKFLNLTGRETYYSQSIYGKDSIIAVVDTGVSPHSELSGNLLKGKSFVDYTSNTSDDNGHGTHVAATISGTNVGIAPDTQILPVKVLDKEGSGSIESLIEALNWINSYNGRYGKNITAVNMSLSADSNLSVRLIDGLHRAIKKLVDNSVAVIVAAGNSSKAEIRYPAAYEEVICVGAVDINLKRAMFSTMGDHVDVCEIGVDVVSAWYKGGYAIMSGTSMATPIVSGIAALISSKYKQVFNEYITEDYLWRSLKLNTKDLGIKGADREYGVGFSTLQPLEADMLLKNNSNYVRVNGKRYKLDEKIDIGQFPLGFMEYFTGAYTSINKTDAKILY